MNYIQHKIIIFVKIIFAGSRACGPFERSWSSTSRDGWSSLRLCSQSLVPQKVVVVIVILYTVILCGLGGVYVWTIAQAYDTGIKSITTITTTSARLTLGDLGSLLCCFFTTLWESHLLMLSHFIVFCYSNGFKFTMQ